MCIKVSERIDGWLREAYFGQVLDDHPRAIRVFDAFPLTRPQRAPVYALALGPGVKDARWRFGRRLRAGSRPPAGGRLAEALDDLVALHVWNIRR